MIPLKANVPRRTFPLVTVLLILVNLAIFLFQLSLGPRAGEQFLFTYGMIPARVQAALTSPQVPLGTALFPLFTSMFLHGGWLHIIGNMWFLWVFGGNVEDRMGKGPYLIFYLLSGLAAGATHTAFNWNSTIPSLGASGAISGVMGAYLVLYPGSWVLTLVPLIIFWFTVQLPALIVIGLWFLLQFVSGVSSLRVPGSAATGGVAWWAHVGGFLFGLLFVKLFQQKPRWEGTP